MSRKAQYILVVASSILIPIFGYFLITTFFNTQTLTEIPVVRDINPVEAPVELSEPIKLLFVGDIMLDRTIRKDGEEYGYDELFACLEKPFSLYDAVIGNLEGTVTDFASVSRDASYQAPESFRFTFDIEAVRALQDIGLSVVSLANNHIRDFGEEGIQQTVSNLDTLGMVQFGDPRISKQRWVIQDINGTKIAYVAYNQFFGTVEQTLDDLQTVQTQSDIQIVFSHWGDEYVPARLDTKQTAYKFVEQGADLIIGAHPHVIQESETYKDVKIYYSLGNFIFDQYFEPAVTKGLGVEVEIFDKKILSTKEYNVKSERHKGSCFVDMI